MEVGIVKGELIVYSESSEEERVGGEIKTEVLQRNNQLVLRLTIQKQDTTIVQIDFDSINTRLFLSNLNEADFATGSELY